MRRSSFPERPMRRSFWGSRPYFTLREAKNAVGSLKGQERTEREQFKVYDWQDIATVLALALQERVEQLTAMREKFYG